MPRRYSIVFWASILLLAICPPSFAQHYFSSEVVATRSQQPHNFSAFKLNESTLLFYSTLDGGPGIYILDIETENVQLLIPYERDTQIEFVHFTRGDDEVMVDLLGLLYVTDGTQNGTRFIGDFGFEDIGSVSSTLVSSVFTKKYVDGKYYFYHYQGSESDASNDLWQSAGNADSTQRVLLSNAPSILKLMSGPNGDELVLYGYNNSKGFGFWKIDSSKSSGSFVGGFEQQEDKRDLRVLSSTVVRAGTLFCREEWFIGQESQRSLWRMSKDHTLVRLTEGCSRSMVEHNSTAYFLKNGNEVWASDGKTQNTQLIATTGRAQGEFAQRFDIDFCLSHSSLFLEIPEQGIWRYRIKTDSSSFIKMPPNTSLACLENGIFAYKRLNDNRGELFNDGGVNGLVIYNQVDDTSFRVFGQPSQLSLPGYRTTLGISPASFAFKFGEDFYYLSTWFNGAERFEDEVYGSIFSKLEFKNTQFLGFLPSVNYLLQDDSE